jgi:hypothetical protein
MPHSFPGAHSAWCSVRTSWVLRSLLDSKSQRAQRYHREDVACQGLGGNEWQSENLDLQAPRPCSFHTAIPYFLAEWGLALPTSRKDSGSFLELKVQCQVS